MIRRLLTLYCAFSLFALIPMAGLGQTSENHVVEHLDASELGPYEPTKRPDLDDAEKINVFSQILIR